MCPGGGSLHILGQAVAEHAAECFHGAYCRRALRRKADALGCHQAPRIAPSPATQSQNTAAFAKPASLSVISARIQTGQCTAPDKTLERHGLAKGIGSLHRATPCPS
jgi:hypothetical protein